MKTLSTCVLILFWMSIRQFSFGNYLLLESVAAESELLLACPCCTDGELPWTLVTHNSSQSASLNVSGGGTATVVIQWGDDDVSTITSDGTVDHDYATCGPFTVTIEVYCNNFVVDTYTTVVDFCPPFPDGCIPGFTSSIGTGGLAAFVSLAGIVVDNDDSELVYVTVNWGDGIMQELNSNNAFHQYNMPGNYPICISATCVQSGLSSVQCETVSVGGTGTCSCCTSSAQFTPGACGLVVEGVISIPEGQTVTIQWGDGDLSTYSASGPFVHTYENCGVFTITITAWCNGEPVQTFSFPYTISCDPDPDCNDGDYCEPPILEDDTVEIYEGWDGSHHMVGPWMNNDNQEIVFSVNWGDGETELCDSTECVHQYVSPGTYNICITASCVSSGIGNSLCSTITIIGDNCPCCDPAADPLITYDPNGLYVEIEATGATGVITVIEWGDGTSTQVNGAGVLGHTFSQCGTYQITFYTLCAETGEFINPPQTITFEVGTPCLPDIALSSNGCTHYLSVNVIDFIYGDEDLFGPRTLLMHWGDGISSTVIVNCIDTDLDGFADGCIANLTDQEDLSDYVTVVGEFPNLWVELSHTYSEDGEFAVTIMKADFDDYGNVSILDIAGILSPEVIGCEMIAPCMIPGDLDGNGAVSVLDVLLIMANFGLSCSGN